ncbi:MULTISPECIES: hypothetical protein [Leptolyngbya]|uniref:hypothetical protein n=1 Tax=Leptolyngbya TaxID=47251 RepID=UPI00168855F6|nr:hypothetical protein [Leptolyngbya sp. FACHB-1624]MBD1859858.1 hypothetical protein [Leptolyngbya sp. FACHB-1624]
MNVEPEEGHYLGQIAIADPRTQCEERSRLAETLAGVENWLTDQFVFELRMLQKMVESQLLQWMRTRSFSRILNSANFHIEFQQLVSELLNHQRLSVGYSDCSHHDPVSLSLNSRKDGYHL